MKTKLLRKLRKINVIYKRNNEYRYICHIPADGGNWYIDTGWKCDIFNDTKFTLKLLQEQRRDIILTQARQQYKPPKSKI